MVIRTHSGSADRRSFATRQTRGRQRQTPRREREAGPWPRLRSSSLVIFRAARRRKTCVRRGSRPFPFLPPTRVIPLRSESSRRDIEPSGDITQREKPRRTRVLATNISLVTYVCSATNERRSADAWRRIAILRRICLALGTSKRMQNDVCGVRMLFRTRQALTTSLFNRFLELIFT